MPDLTAREALEYAISPRMLRLFGVVLLGQLLLSVAFGLIRSGPFHGFRGIVSLLPVLQWLVGVALALVGLLALYGGLVAILYVIIVDGTAHLDRRSA